MEKSASVDRGRDCRGRYDQRELAFRRGGDETNLVAI